MNDYDRMWLMLRSFNFEASPDKSRITVFLADDITVDFLFSPGGDILQFIQSKGENDTEFERGYDEGYEAGMAEARPEGS